MPSSNTDRNLLFGILAVQMDFITKDALIQAMNAWVLDKRQPLGQILLEQKALFPDTHALLEALVAKHLELHQNDPERSLASVSSVGSVREDLRKLVDEEIDASLAYVSAARKNEDPHATRPFEAGDQTSAGLRFRILRPHDKGALGEVFVAEDQELHREVALKEIQEQYADDPQARARFLLEAEITGGLEHPGIVPVYGLGKYADGRPFYAMRFIKGDNLKNAIERFHKAEGPDRDPGEKSLEFRKLLRRFQDVCNAVAYAHSRGVLHRDLKPGNIMLGQYGETLVVDWGLAKTREQEDSSVTRPERPIRPQLGSGSEPTKMGAAIGTPAYMSPEQAAGRLDQLGPASDVYSLGATLYSLLTGQAPFQGAQPADVLRKVQSGDFLPPRQIKADVPAALDAICKKAMAISSDARYPSTRELVEDIEHWLADEPVRVFNEPVIARLSRWGRRHKPLVASVAALMLASIVALLIGIFLVNEERQRTDRERLAAVEAREEAGRQTEQARDNFILARDTVKRYCLEVSADPRLRNEDLRVLRNNLLQTAVSFHKQCIEKTREAPGLREDRADAFYQLGSVRREIANPSEAIDDYQEALKLYEELSQEHPNNHLNARHLASCEYNLGVLFESKGDSNAALKHHERALTLRRELSDFTLAEPDLKRDVAQSHSSLGIVYEAIARRDDALKSFHNALAIRKELAERLPFVADYQFDMAKSYRVIGEFLRQIDRFKESEENLQKAIMILRALERSYPAESRYQESLAETLVSLGHLWFRGTGEVTKAEDAFNQNLALSQRIADLHPSVISYQEGLAASYSLLGTLSRNAKHNKKAEDLYHMAINVRKRLADLYPGLLANQIGLACDYTNLGNTYRDLLQAKDAEEYLRKAIDAMKNVANRRPERPDIKADLAVCYFNLSGFFSELGRPGESLPWIKLAVSTVESALRQDPDNGKAKLYFRKFHEGYILAYSRLGLHAEAAAKAESLRLLAPDNVSNLFNVACGYAVCCSVVGRDKMPSDLSEEETKTRQRYSNAALDLLVKIEAAGFFKHPDNLALLKSESDLDPLRQRDDFKKLVSKALAGAKK
jgi:serine/threonine-protein kinase